MSNTLTLTLQRTNASAYLVPAELTRTLAVLAKLPGRRPEPHGEVRGQELRLAVGLPLDDAACATFLLEFAAQGVRVRGSTRGPGAELLAWAFHALAASLECDLVDEETRHQIAPNAEAHREAAVAYLAAYEAGVHAWRRGSPDDGAAFVAWLVREEYLALANSGDTLGGALPMDDVVALYEMLLDSDAVDDVFVSEREVTSLLARFRAR
jgi:hypothetical protein